MFNEHYSFADRPVLVARTPSLPISALTELYADPRTAVAEILSLPMSPLAFHYASESLSAELQEGTQNLKDSALTAAVAYGVRMSTRCTPFGLFAAVGTAEVGDETSLRVAGSGDIEVHIRPDLSWTDGALRDGVLKKAQEPRIALTHAFQRRGDRLFILNPRVVQNPPSFNKGERPDFAPVIIRNTAAVRFLIQSLDAPLALSDIVMMLANAFGEPTDAARTLVEELLAAGLLVDDRRVHPFFGNDTAALWNLVYENAGVDDMPSLRFLQSHTGRAPDAKTHAAYKVAAEKLNTMYPSTMAPFQLDATRKFQGVLGREILDEVSVLADAFVRTTPANMTGFRSWFLERYGNLDEEIPLLEILDPVSGFRFDDAGPADRSTGLDERANAARFDLAAKALALGHTTVNLSQHQLHDILPQVDSRALPPSLEIGFEVAARSLASVNAGDYLVVPATYTGSTGAFRAAGRFAWALGEKLTSKMKDFGEFSSGSEEITCELVAEPAVGRTLNVCARPSTTSRELRVGYEAVQSAVDVISPRNIVVGFDGYRFYARCALSGKRLRIVETHNLNMLTTSTSIGRFLSMLRADGYITSMHFDWGAATRLPRLPRLQVGRVVLSPAMWRFTRSELEQVLIGEDDPRRQQLPRWVQYGTFDNWLIFDLESRTARELLISQIRKAPSETSILVEAISNPETCWLESEAGSRYRCEFVASAIRTSVEHLPAPAAAPASRRAVHALGSEWTYVKIYCAEEDTEEIIKRFALPIVTRLREAGRLAQWHFVRYADPRYHVRLRIKDLKRDLTWLPLFLELLQEGIHNGYISDIAFPSYEPEVGRYGGIDGLAICESIFTLDSERTLERLLSIPEKLRFAQRLEACLERSIVLGDILVNDVGVVSPRSLSPHAESLDRSERELVRKAVRGFLSHDTHDPHYATAVRQLLSIGDSLSQPLDRIIGSLFHMHCNRFGVFPDRELRVRLMTYQALISMNAQRSVVTA